ncbi:MAG TPA: hypothetical protein VME47_19135, partial [Acetobacteraceae bacterium]|nr:hypothetical protein [Acetobacteraceae bacterium]
MSGSVAATAPSFSGPRASVPHQVGGGISPVEGGRGSDVLLDIRNLKTWFKTDDGMIRAVDGVDLS